MIEQLLEIRQKLHRFKIVFIITTAIIILLSGSVIAAQNIVVTDVLCDNEIKTVFSFSAEPDDIVALAKFEVEEKDKLILDYFDSENKDSLLIVAKEHDVLIYDDGKLTKIVTVAGTIEDALNKAGVKLKDGDKLSIGKSVGISEDVQLKIFRAFPVTVTVDGEKKKVNVTDCTAEEALKTAGITLGKDDIVTPKRETKLTKKTKIKVQRVTYKTVKKKSAIPYETKVKYDKDLYEEKVYVKKDGKNGTKVNYYENKYIDGKLVESKRIKSKVTKEPVTKVVVRGSKPSLYGGGVASRIISEVTPPYRIDLDENNRPVKYKKKITGKATAYSGGGITSTGRRAMPGVVAVDPREIPYGTKMFIISSDGRYIYGYAIAGDTGGFIHNSSTVVDLYMHSHGSCVQFGRRNVEIYILE